MTRLISGVAIASVVLFVWGFLVWELGPYRTMIWKPVKDDDATAKFVRDLFPENGVYFFPNTSGDEKSVAAAAQRGPVAMIHMTAVEGRPAFDPVMMAKGFVLNVVVLVLIAMLLEMVGGALPAYWDRVKFVALAGLAVAVFFDGGDVVWWGLDQRWKLYQAFYSVSFWCLAGLILAYFVAPAASARTKAASAPVAAAKT